MCGKCHQSLPFSFFFKNKCRKPPYSSYCRKCHTKDTTSRAKRNGNVSRSAFYSLKSGTKRRGIHLGMSQDEFCKWYDSCEQVCHYCGITQKKMVEISWGADFRFSGEYARMSVDRKDSLVGYVEENLVLSCMVCNIVKGMFLSYGDMLLVGKNIIRPKWAFANGYESHWGICL